MSDDEARVATALTLVSGVRYEVEGSPEKIEETIVAASRGSIMQLAWVTDADSGRSIGINPQHVVSLEPA